MATVVHKYAGATTARSTYSNVYNTSAVRGTPAPTATGRQTVIYSKPQTTQSVTYNNRGATIPPVSTASAGAQTGTVIVKMSGTSTTKITTPAVTASSNHVTTTAGRTAASKQLGTPAVVATNSVKTTSKGTSATRITTPAVVAGHVTTINQSSNTKRVGTPAVTVYTTTYQSRRTISTPAVTHSTLSSMAAENAMTKNLASPSVSESSPLEGVHTFLDTAGFVPIVGDFADLVNGVIYAAEGDLLNAGISAMAMIPFCDAASGARLATKVTKEVLENTVETVARKTVRNGAEEVAEAAAERVGREAAESVAERTGREVVEGGSRTINGFDTTVNTGKQGKHIIGNNNYIEGRSVFNGTVDDAQRLVDDFAGTGEWIGTNKERVNFGEVIGQYVNPATNEAVDTTVGIIHYSKTGTHIVPAQPIQ